MKKIKIRRETLRVLAAQDLRAPRGGANPTRDVAECWPDPPTRSHNEGGMDETARHSIKLTACGCPDQT